MADDELITELVARLDRVEAENRRLSAALEQLSGTDAPSGYGDPAEVDGSKRVDRRGLLKRAGAVALGAAAVTAASQALDAPAAAAADGQPMLMGQGNKSRWPTFVNSDGNNGIYPATLHVTSNVAFSERKGHAIHGLGQDYGVAGVGYNRAGVIGLFPNVAAQDTQIDHAGVGGVGANGAAGVMGVSDWSDGVRGFTEEGRGVAGFCQQATGDLNVGVHGVLVAESGLHLGSSLGFAGVVGDSRDFTGVQGLSTNYDGVNGHSGYARGGVFSGGAAAVRLSPGAAATPPTGGLTGDLLVDSTGRLWYCRRGGDTATWVALAS